MDVREKLIEILKQAPFEGKVLDEWWWEEKIRIIADHLIINCVTVQEQDGCEYCNGLPFSQMEDFTMPNASKKDYDIVTIRYCPICGRRLPQPPKGE